MNLSLCRYLSHYGNLFHFRKTPPAPVANCCIPNHPTIRISSNNSNSTIPPSKRNRTTWAACCTRPTSRWLMWRWNRARSECAVSQFFPQLVLLSSIIIIPIPIIISNRFSFSSTRRSHCWPSVSVRSLAIYLLVLRQRLRRRWLRYRVNRPPPGTWPRRHLRRHPTTVAPERPAEDRNRPRPRLPPSTVAISSIIE